MRLIAQAQALPLRRLISRVIIAGGTHLSRMLAGMLSATDMKVCLIEPDRAAAEKAADALGANALIIEGESTDIGVLQEAGIDGCDAFIASNQDSETNILSCILAKRNGAGKVIAVTRNPDYVNIIAGMNMIDCGFIPLVAAVNILIKHISRENRKNVALLMRSSAEVMEMTVPEKSAIAGEAINPIIWL